MIGSQFLRTKSSSSQVWLATGAVALAGIALVCAIPQTRKACGRWINNMVARAKERMNGQNGGGNWESDLENAERLKGPMAKRKNTAKISPPNVASPAWKDEWSSE
jgi:hypothetical protein